MDGERKPRSTVVFLYGPPAVGKLTIAEVLAERTGFKLAHSHLIIDAITRLFPFGTEPFTELLARFRDALYETVARQGVDLIFTYCYRPTDKATVTTWVESVRDHDGRVLFVQLVASHESLIRRVALPSRQQHGKIVDTASLDDVLKRWDFSRQVPFRPNLRIDTDTLDPIQAAAYIINQYGLVQLPTPAT